MNERSHPSVISVTSCSKQTTEYGKFVLKRPKEALAKDRVWFPGGKPSIRFHGQINRVLNERLALITVYEFPCLSHKVFFDKPFYVT